jgi:hypothetical protein
LSLELKVAMGDRLSLLAQVFTVASVVALLSASLSFMELVSGFLSGAVPASYAPLARGISAELEGLVYLWSIPVWAVLVVSFYVLVLYASGQMAPTLVLLWQLGSSRAISRRVLLLRLALVSSIGWVLGLSLGLVLAQVGFRAAALLSRTAYYVPSLSPFDVLVLAGMTFSACAAGALLPIYRSS